VFAIFRQGPVSDFKWDPLTSCAVPCPESITITRHRAASGSESDGHFSSAPGWWFQVTPAYFVRGSVSRIDNNGQTPNRERQRVGWSLSSAPGRWFQV